MFFKIQSINVTGDDIYNAETIVAASGLNVGENMFKSSKKDISNKLETSLPYIESVRVKRSPTGNVTLTITAAKAELAIDCGEGYILLNKNGKVLEDGVVSINEDVATVTASAIVTATPGDVIVFENEQDTQTLKDIKSIIDSKQIEKITDINITQNSSIVLTYDMRITLEVGMVSTLEQKSILLRQLWTSSIPTSRVSREALILRLKTRLLSTKRRSRRQLRRQWQLNPKHREQPHKSY